MQEMNGHQKQKEQSRQMIVSALFELLDEKEYSKISVSEIVKRADVARRTFYRLYDNKEDIIRNYFEQLCQEYQNSYPKLDSYNFKQIAREYFSFWYQYRDRLLKFHKSGMDDILYYSISSTSTQVIKSRIAQEHMRQVKGLEYFADYSGGGFISLLFCWIESGMEVAPEQYADMVSEGILKFISIG